MTGRYAALSAGLPVLALVAADVFRALRMGDATEASGTTDFHSTLRLFRPR